MSTLFDEAVEKVLKFEGGFVDNPSDPGGVTNYGISLRFIRSLSDADLKDAGLECLLIDDHPQAIRDLTKDMAKSIYKKFFWDTLCFDKLGSKNLVIYFFDMCVNMGNANAVKCLQRAIWSITPDIRRTIIDDGILGPKTLQYVNSFSVSILFTLRSERASYYKLLAAKNPEQKIFLTGWLNRTYT